MSRLHRLSTGGLPHVREWYQVPARRGGLIRFTHTGELGTIVGARNARLRVRFPSLQGKIVSLHPTWRVDYL